MVPKEDLWFFIKRAIIDADEDRSRWSRPSSQKWVIVDGPLIERHRAPN
jgi:hypothetical protein